MARGKSKHYQIQLSNMKKEQDEHHNRIIDSPSEKVNYGYIKGLNRVNLSVIQRNMLFFTVAGSIGFALGAPFANINQRKSTITYDGSHRLSKAEIEMLVNEKVTLNSKLIRDKISEAKCNQIKENTIETANQPGFTNDHFFRPLTNPNFKAECPDDLFLYEDSYDDSPPAPVRFFTILKTLLFDVNVEKSDASRVINHEFIHADHFHLKDDKNSPCNVPSHKALTPVYPITKEEIKKYKDALYLGINRAKTAKEVFINQIQNKVLTSKEQKLYNQYHSVLEGWWGLKESKETGIISKEHYQFYKKNLSENNGNPLLVSMPDGTPILVLDVFIKKNGRYYIIYQSTSTQMAILENLIDIEDKLKTFFKTEWEQSSEGEAYGLQDLHDAARNLIFPEMMAA